MLKRMNLALAGVLVIVFQFLLAGNAAAVSVSVEASVVCTLGTPIIRFTARPWNPDPSAANPQIEIRFNSVPVATGAFQAPDYSFSGAAAAPPGEQVTVTAIALGAWGGGFTSGQSASIVVAIPSDCVVAGTGRFTGGGKQVRVGDLTVTRGLTIHCDLLLSNNLEVNWGGNRFHMTQHMTTVSCSDDPTIVQAPPGAPLDTLVGVGSGRYNNTEGYTIRFTLVDAGEPGVVDRMAILIFETANPANVVLNVPLQHLTGGNLQAHRDQPHRR